MKIIQNKKIEFVRLRLREWATLEGLKQEIDTATSKHDFQLIFSHMVKFIEVAVSPSPSQIDWEKVPWYEFLEVYSEIIRVNSPRFEFPILRNRGETKKQPWEYVGRSWYFWFNLFATNYGWTEEIIANLDMDDAIGLYQELELERQLEHEWEWGLSEIAYPYEKATKSSKFKPLPRPSWMMPMIPKQLPIVKMRKDHIPVGNIVNLMEPQKKEAAKRGI